MLGCNKILHSDGANIQQDSILAHDDFRDFLFKLFIVLHGQPHSSQSAHWQGFFLRCNAEWVVLVSPMRCC